jgi:hypothetical protein
MAFLAAVYVLPGAFASSNGAGASSETCVPRHKVVVDRGDHAGRPWLISAGVEKNPSCSFLLLKMEFSPLAETRGSWTGGWGIPAHGHLSDAATIAAGDHLEGSERSVSGVVGSRVRRVVFKMSTGHEIVVNPKLPSEALRERFVWLHGLRYFLRFYPTGEHVRAARLLDAKGKLISIVRADEGEIEGFMSV